MREIDPNSYFDAQASAGIDPKDIYRGGKQLGLSDDDLASAWNVWGAKHGNTSSVTTGDVVKYATPTQNTAYTAPTEYTNTSTQPTQTPSTQGPTPGTGTTGTTQTKQGTGLQTSPTTDDLSQHWDVWNTGGKNQQNADDLFASAVKAGVSPKDIYQQAIQSGMTTDQLATAWNDYNKSIGSKANPISGQQVYNFASQKGYTPQTYDQNIGNSYTGLGKTNTTGYDFLPQTVKDQIKNQGSDNKYAYLDAEGKNSFTVGQLLEQRKADPAAIEANNRAYERQQQDGGGPLQYIDPNQDLYLWNPATQKQRAGREGDVTTTQAEYLTKDQFLQRVGTTNPDARVALTADGAPNIASNASQVGGADQGTQISNPGIGHNSTTPATMGLGATPLSANSNTFNDAVTDPNLKGFVQLGDGGTLYDDIPQVLGAIYKQAGIENDPAKQEQVKQQLFRYDPRFGVLMDQRILNAVMDASAAGGSQGGFFYKNMGTLSAIAMSVLTAGVGAPALFNAALSGIQTAGKGGSLGDIGKSVLTSYIGSNLAPLARDATGDLLALTGGATPLTASIVEGGIKGMGSGVLSQLSTTGSIDPKLLAAQGLAGGVGGGVSDLVTNNLSGVVNGKLATGAGNLAGTVAGNAITGKNTSALSAGMGLLPGLAKAYNS